MYITSRYQDNLYNNKTEDILYNVLSRVKKLCNVM